MLNYLKQKMKNNSIMNNTGSVLSVALIVITVLTFSVSTITQLSINLSGQTNRKLESVSNENTAKALIDQSISEFETYLSDEATLGDFDGFNATEIPRILNAYNVVVTDETANLDGFGDTGEAISYAYKFAYTLNNGNVIYKYGYVSNYGTTVENLNPFDYQIGTNGDAILNGGYYDEVNIFGDRVRVSRVAPYTRSGTNNQYLTPENNDNYPLFYTTGPSTIYENNGYTYCVANCFQTNNSGNPFVINESYYLDVDETAPFNPGTSDSTNIVNFFGDFDFEAFMVEFINTKAPARTNTINATWNTLETTILNNSSEIVATYKNNGSIKKCNWPNDDFVNITDFVGTTCVDFEKDFKQGNSYYSMVYEGNLDITTGISMKDQESLVVIGDLTLSATASKNIEGSIFVFGDLTLEGSSKDFEGSVFVLGETFINFNDDQGILTNGNNAGFTLITHDNIYFNSHYESHNSSNLAPGVSAFIYTEESIFIDAVNNRLNMTGSLFARALGNSTNTIFMEDEALNPINGIVINSYRGYINNAGSPVAGPSDTSHRFRLGFIASGNYQDRFVNIPTFESVIQTEGVYSFEEGEFAYE